MTRISLDQGKTWREFKDDVIDHLVIESGQTIRLETTVVFEVWDIHEPLPTNWQDILEYE